MAQMGGCGVVWLVRVLRLRGRAQGTVVREAPSDGISCAVVSFVTADGVRFEFEGDDGRPTGATVPVRYDEHDPNRARVDTFEGSFFLPALCFFGVLVGVALIVATG